MDPTTEPTEGGVGAELEQRNDRSPDDAVDQGPDDGAAEATSTSGGAG